MDKKIVQARKLLGIPEGLRILEHIKHQLNAHDYKEMYNMPDDVFMAILEERDDFAKESRK